LQEQLYLNARQIGDQAVLDLFARLPDYEQEHKSLLTLKFQILNSPLLTKQVAG
jgi:hypothetical protein